MLYYDYKLKVKEEIAIPEDRHENISWVNEITEKAEEVNRNQDYNVHFYIYAIKSDFVKIFGIIGYKNKKNPKELVLNFGKEMGFDIVGVEGGEISIHTLGTCARKARYNHFLDDEDRVLETGCIGSYGECTSHDYTEFMVDENLSKTKAKAKAEDTNCGQSLVDELDRIYIKQKQKTFIGNPVHYIVYTNDWENAQNIASILTSAIYHNNRLKTKRVALIRPEKSSRDIPDFLKTDGDVLDMDTTSNLLRIQQGGAIVIKPGKVADDGMIAKEEDFHIEALAREIDKNKIETLSIIVFNREEKAVASQLKVCLPDLKFVEIEEKPFLRDRAIELLNKKAKADGISEISSLIEKIGNADRNYTIADVNKIYSNWLVERLPNEVYSQYHNIEKTAILNIPGKGSAYTRLQSLIGLKSAKEVIQEALDFHKAQVLFRRAGIEKLNPARHMIFTGNPGTAKTTVARLFAQIMKDNGVLDKGDLIEVGRKDLVGKYVGWTAKLVEEAFAKAQGSVLFIDEAYSLCEERGGLYGDEAINTIVQMMENQRSNTVVIFAGYPDKMETFLDKNPGLRSRIAFHVNFEDYSSDDLVRILELMAIENKVLLGCGVMEKAKSLFEDAIKQSDFGNGRYVRNIFEQARMKQASRLVKMKTDNLTDEVIRTLTVEDFSTTPVISPKQTNRVVGFAS